MSLFDKKKNKRDFRLRGSDGFFYEKAQEIRHASGLSRRSSEGAKGEGGPPVFFLFFFLIAFLCAPPAFAQQGGLSVIRDAEIETYLRELGTPIFQAAGLDPQAVSLVIVQSAAINAFVAGGQNIFFYTGLLQKTETPDELLGVIAHETGHIAGGHLVRGSEAMKNASTEAIIGALAALAAGLATGRGDVAVGAIGGAHEVATRNLMSYSRAQESSADAAAMSFLDKTGQSPKGLLSFMKKLGAQDLLPESRQDEYVRTHPLSQDRVESISFQAARSPHTAATLDPKFAVMHARMKAKFLGFLQPQTALLRYTDKDPRTDARYARAIALYRTHRLDRALDIMEPLLAEEPDNPFFIELKAQMLFENGRVGQAAALYQKAVALLPSSALLKVSYAHALLEEGDLGQLNLAIETLLEANRIEPREPQTWRFLAAAWSRKAETEKSEHFQGLVSYALAEEALAKGQEKAARIQAERALEKLPKNSPYWLRAQDIKLTTGDKAKD